MIADDLLFVLEQNEVPFLVSKEGVSSSDRNVIFDEISRRTKCPVTRVDLLGKFYSNFIGLIKADTLEPHYESWIVPFLDIPGNEKNPAILVFDNIGMADDYVLSRLGRLVFGVGAWEFDRELHDQVSVIFSLGEVGLQSFLSRPLGRFLFKYAVPVEFDSSFSTMAETV